MRNGAAVPMMMIGAVLFASPAAGQADDEDNPGRGVARISVVNGDVSVRRGDSGDWVAAAVNAPLVVEDTVATGPNSRAEVQFDYANILRLGPNAEAKITELEHRRYQVQLARGPAEFSVLRDSDADVDVSTPEISVRPSRRGRYRIHVMEGQTEVAVRSGEVEVYTPRGVERVSSGRAILVRGGAGGPEFQTIAAMPRDEFDRWSENRDRSLERSGGYRYVNRSIYGVEDLDGHGRWVYDPPYGWVWVPRAGPDWAPYRHGRWVWQDWYGWTWVSHDPWGWAPYHWGRWYHGHHGWCWYPGPIHRVHYWRPALVAFFGFGVGPVRVGFGFGRVGWVPLAPYEPYYPWYGRHVYGGYRGHSTYVDRSVHVTNVNITNVYRNARVRHAVSGVDADGFGRGGRNIVRVGDGEIRQAGLVRGQLPVGPDRDSLRFADREARHIPRASDGERRFYSRRQAAPVERVSFSEQQRAFERGRRGAAEGIAAQPAGAPAGAGAQVERQGERREGWRRAGERGGTERGVAAAAPAETRERGGERGWRRFGEPSRGTTDRGAGGAAETPQSPRTGEPGERGSWRRFGENRGGPEQGAAPAASPAETRERTGGWPRFGEPSRGTTDRGAGGAAETPRSPRTGEPGERGNWRRFGEGGTRETPAVRTEPVERNRTWRRFGDPGQSEALTPRSSEPSGSGGSVRRSEPAERTRNWQRFGEPGGARPSEPVRRQQSAEPRSAEPFRRSESMEGSRGWSMPRSMEERRAPRSGGEAWGGSGGRRDSGRSVEMPRGGMSRGERGMGGGGGGERSGGGGTSVSRGEGGGGRGRHR